MTQIEIHPTARLHESVAVMGAASIGANVDIGANVTLYPKAHIGEGTRILSGAVIGRPPIRAGTTNRPIQSGDETVRIGANCVIGANAVIYTNVQIGNNVMVSDLASLREGCRLEDDTIVGRASMLMHDVTLQARSRIHDMVHLTGHMLVEPDVFVGPSVSSANDNRVYLTRFGLQPFGTTAPVIRRFAVVGTGAIIGAGVEIGRGAIVAPGAAVTKDAPAWTIVAGLPAKPLREVDESWRLGILRKFGLSDEAGA